MSEEGLERWRKQVGRGASLSKEQRLQGPGKDLSEGMRQGRLTSSCVFASAENLAQFEFEDPILPRSCWVAPQLGYSQDTKVHGKRSDSSGSLAPAEVLLSISLLAI